MPVGFADHNLPPTGGIELDSLLSRLLHVTGRVELEAFWRSKRVHINMLVDMSDAVIGADGERIYEDGRFLISRKRIDLDH